MWMGRGPSARSGSAHRREFGQDFAFDSCYQLVVIHGSALLLPPEEPSDRSLAQVDDSAQE